MVVFWKPVAQVPRKLTSPIGGGGCGGGAGAGATFESAKSFCFAGPTAPPSLSPPAASDNDRSLSRPSWR